MKLDVEKENLSNGVLGLVMALVEIIHKILEHQAIRRMESGRLSDERIERLGQSLMKLEETIMEIESTHGLWESVAKLRKQLDDVVDGSLFDIGKEGL